MQRAGLLTQPAFLAVNAHASTTAPIKRGNIVRKKLLCLTTPDPPAGVKTTLPEQFVPTTMREQVKQHEANPACAACHVGMDGIGLGFEAYDAVGAFRTMDAGQPVDSSGAIIGTRTLNGDFNGAIELAHRLSTSPGGTYPWLNIGSDGHHSLTHQDPRQFPDTTAKQIAIKHYYATMFASLLTKLDAVPEGNGTLLDNSIVVWGSELGDAYAHNPEPTPFIVAGGGAGALRMGQHLDCQGVYHNRLLVSICQAMGAEDVMTFGHTDGGSGGLVGLT